MPYTDYHYFADRGDGTYTNPILFADYSDPDVTRVGTDYYMVSSSFNFIPGLPVLHSTDLINWIWLSNALKKLPSHRYDEIQPGCGVWAPAIRYHAGRFWIFFPMPDEGIYVVTAKDAAGPWSEPHLLQAGKGLIDPCPLWDDDGNAYLVFAYAGSRAGIKHRLHVRPMAPDGSALLGDGHIVFDGTVDHPTVEGPKFLKKDGFYYISAPAGGVSCGWQIVLRSTSVYGPYEVRTVIAQRGTEVNGPHQGALVDDVEGDWWFLHFQERQPYGRICHLQPVQWRDAWPLVGESIDASGVGRPVLSYRKPAGHSGRLAPLSSDDFDSPELGLQWAFPANPVPGTYNLTARPGFLRLYAEHVPRADCHASSRTISQKVSAEEFRAEAALDFVPHDTVTEAGLAVLGIDTFQLGVGYETTGGNGWRRILMVKKNNELLHTLPCPDDRLNLLLDWGSGGSVQFGYRTGNDIAIQWVGPRFQVKEGVWVGARIGLFCLSQGPLPSKAYVDFDYFHIVSRT
ncbi:MAG TPA: glycoside hydrolase 43 family protein [Spirochaetia bacterium]|nr:glycoside hydrolase 43 family protein [Spirochaetia bacterium]